MEARIYKPSKSATQSGWGRTGEWILEYELETPRLPESLMGWTASGDTLNQVRIAFQNLDDAIAFAEKKGLVYSVLAEHRRRVKPRNYGDNFRYQPENERESA